MARIRVACLVSRANKGGAVSWYWQPSATLARAGWKPLALGKDEGAAIAAARARNAEVEAWKIGPGGVAGDSSAPVRPRVQSGTIAAGIDRYEREVLHGRKPNGQPILAGTTVKTYRTGLDRLRRWGGPHPIAYVTPARVRVLRDAMLAAPEKGGIGHHAAHQTLKMGRALWAFFIACDLAPANPFDKFKLAAPEPRDVIWSPPAREAMIAAAHAAGRPSLALAIMLGFAVGQREADLLALSHNQWVALPAHKMQPEDFATLAGLAPDGVPRGIRVRQQKTRAWIEGPVVGAVRAALEANIAAARAAGFLAVLLDDTRGADGRGALYAGESGQTRFQRDFADIRQAAADKAEAEGDGDLAAELATLQFRDLRRTCVVYLGELGMDAHLIAAVTGHDIDDTQRILRTYMPRTTGRAARAVALASIRQAKDAAGHKASNIKA